MASHLCRFDNIENSNAERNAPKLFFAEQVPLMYTVYALISFRKFKAIDTNSNEDGTTEDWYTLPSGYSLKTFEEMTATKRSRKSQSWDSADAIPEGTTEDDAKVLAQMGL